MNIKTKYNVGDRVFTIDSSTFKVKELVIDNISIVANGSQTVVTLYEDGAYSGYREDRCFPTEAELITFITTPNAKTL